MAVFAASNGAVPLKWAHDTATGAVRYIHDIEVVSRQCKCTCPACGLPLTAVKPDKPLERNPVAHFRHPSGVQKTDCTIVAARLAVARYFLETGFIDLPRRRLCCTAKGFSGAGYDVWMECPPERVAITQAVLLPDRVTALLTLPDGRELEVDLTGQRTVDNLGQGRAIVTVDLSDPDLAMLSLEEIRARLHIPSIGWCAHWRDPQLLAQGAAQARTAAQAALDGWSDEEEARFHATLAQDGLGTIDLQSARSESLLHSTVKAILQSATSLMTPGLQVEHRSEPSEELSDSLGASWEESRWNEHVLELRWQTPAQAIPIEGVNLEVTLETGIGQIVPDAIASLPEVLSAATLGISVGGQFMELIEENFPHRWTLSRSLLIEVTVHHAIGAEKMRRLRELDQPTLEIDLSAFVGRLTLDGLRDLVLNQLAGKRWVHHPSWRNVQRRLKLKSCDHPVTRKNLQLLFEFRRPRLLTTPASQWAKSYIKAFICYEDESVRREAAQRQGHLKSDTYPEIKQDSPLWPALLESSQGLDAHGLPGSLDSALRQVIARLLSIRYNRGIGYDVGTGWQVIAAIMQSKNDSQWLTLFSIAVKAYDLQRTFKPDQAQKYALWRQRLIERVKAGDKACLRPASHDAVLGVLFPEMAQGLATGFGREA